MASKKTVMCKSVFEEVTEFTNNYKTTTQTQASINEPAEDDDVVSRLIKEYQENAKKKKTEVCSGTNPESLKMMLDLVGNQLIERKQCTENFFKSLKALTTRIEADLKTLKENELQLEYLTETFMIYIQQATAAYKHKLKALKQIHTSFENKCKEMETCHKIETEKLVNELEYDIKKMQEKIVADTKRNNWESLRRSIFHAMQNYF